MRRPIGPRWRRVDGRPKGRVTLYNILGGPVGYMDGIRCVENIISCCVLGYMYSLCGEYNILVCGIFVFAVWRV